jgi:hypothetical protein
MFNSIFPQLGGILLTTYDIVRNNYKLIRGNSYNNDDDDEEGTVWNYVILDEGHLIKNNKTQRAQSLFEIPCAHRIVISGTPIQNNLKVSLIPFLNSSNLYMIYNMLLQWTWFYCRKCGLCSISAARMSWVINNSNFIHSITLYCSCILKFGWIHNLVSFISLLQVQNKVWDGYPSRKWQECYHSREAHRLKCS